MKNYFRMFQENAVQFLGFNEKFKIYGCDRNDYLKMKVKWVFLLITEGCSAEDYFTYHFYHKNHAERKEYVTLLKGKWIIRKLNGRGDRKVVEDKAVFHKYFTEFLHRNCMSSKELSYENFTDLLRGGVNLIVKPQKGFNGNGIYIIKGEMSEGELRKEYEKIKSEDYVVEEVLEQDGILKQLNPGTLNTVRVNAFYCNGSVEIINAILRSGQGNTVTDNICAGGCVAGVNIKSGMVETPFYDLSNHIYDVHPLSKIKMEGEFIPSWEKVVSTVEQAVKIVPDLGYTSWDIAVIKGGKVAIVEGNSYGNFNIQQVTGEGVRRKYQRYMRDWKSWKK